MTLIRIVAAAAAMSGFAMVAWAQAPPQGQGAAPPTSPAGSMMGHGPGHGMGMGWGAQSTYGWSMMSPAERQEHMAKMHGFTSRAECQSFVAEHHRLMAERAKQRGMAMPAAPPHDPCAGLK